MRLKRRGVLILLVFLFGLTIMAGASDAQLQKDPPDFKQYENNVGTDEASKFLFETMSTLRKGCEQLPSRPMTAEEKEKEIKYYESDDFKKIIFEASEKANKINSGGAGFSRADSVRMYRNMVEQNKKMLETKRFITKKYPGAAEVTCNKVEMINLGQKSSGYVITIVIPADAAAEATQIMKNNYALVKKILGDDQSWMYVNDETYAATLARLEEDKRKYEAKNDPKQKPLIETTDNVIKSQREMLNSEYKNWSIGRIWWSKHKTGSTLAGRQNAMDSYNVTFSSAKKGEGPRLSGLYKFVSLISIGTFEALPPE